MGEARGEATGRAISEAIGEVLQREESDGENHGHPGVSATCMAPALHTMT